MKKMLSALMIVHNGEKFIGEAIHSVLKQTLPSDEFIIINDGSNDRTLDIIAQYPFITVISQEKKGISYSRNLAVQLSEGKYLSFIDADDVWHPDKNRLQLQYLQKNTDIDLLFSYITHFTGNICSNSSAQPPSHKGISLLCCMIEKSKFMSIGMFEEYTVCEFIVWFHKAQLYGLKHECLPETLAYRRLHADNFTRSSHYNNQLTSVAKKLIDQKRLHK